MRASVLERLKRPIELTPGLPGSAYSADAFFDVEFAHVFRRNWVGIGYGHQVAAPGDMLPLEIGPERLLLLRDGDGRVRVFHNVCRHRGARLIDEPGNRRVVSCPYHRWSYGLDGACLAIPQWDRAEGRTWRPPQDAGFGLVEVAAREWMDVVFVDLSGDAPDFDALVAPLASRWDVARIGPRQRISAWQKDMPYNWKLVIENFCDAYHLGYVHPQVGDPGSSADHDLVELSAKVYGLVYRRGAKRRAWTKPLPPIAALAEALGENSESFLVFPNTLVFVHPTFTVSRVVLPRGPKSTHVYEPVYVAADTMAPDYDSARRQIIESATLVADQDLPILARLQDTRGSAALDRGRFAPDWDRRSYMFQRLIAESLPA